MAGMAPTATLASESLPRTHSPVKRIGKLWNYKIAICTSQQTAPAAWPIVDTTGEIPPRPRQPAACSAD